MNIVDRLTQRADNERDHAELSLEAKTRRDMVYSRLRAETGLAPENIDLSECDFTISDTDLRLQVAKARGITSQTAIDEIDLDEVLVPSGSLRRRARRAYARAQDRQRRKGQHKFRAQQHRLRITKGERVSGHEKVVAQRARKAQQDAVAALIKDGVDPQAAYDQVVGANA